jgi:hypothetical protein
LIKRWGSISLPSLPPNPRFALPTPVWPATKAGNLQQDQDRAETTFVIAVAPRTSTNPPQRAEQTQEHLLLDFHAPSVYSAKQYIYSAKQYICSFICSSRCGQS